MGKAYGLNTQVLLANLQHFCCNNIIILNYYYLILGLFPSHSWWADSCSVRLSRGMVCSWQPRSFQGVHPHGRPDGCTMWTLCLMHRCVCIWWYILQNYNYKLHFQNLSIYHIARFFLGEFIFIVSIWNLFFLHNLTFFVKRNDPNRQIKKNYLNSPNTYKA